MDEYAAKLRRICRVLIQTGFLAADKPTDKGTLASRVYGENTLLVTEAIWLGWFEGLQTEELCAVLVMLTAEDRGRDRGPRGPRRYPTPAISQVARAAALPLLSIHRPGEGTRRAEPAPALARLHRLRLPVGGGRGSGNDPAPERC